MSILSSSSDSDSDSSICWDRFRKNFPICRSFAYFDSAAVSPLPDCVVTAIRNWADQACSLGDTVWPQWAARVEEIRKDAAEMVNAAPAEIALVPNTTFGISIVSEGLSWKSGDNVVIPAGEFPSNHYPWLHLADQGVELRVVPTGSDGSFSASDVERFCDSRTRVVAASWVGYASGYRIDPLEIASVAHAHGAFFFLDAIQGMGVFPLDVQDSGIDFFAADGHKWMMGPEGAGLFFCRETLLDELRPRVVGWNSVKSCYDFSTIDLTFKPTAARFEGGSQNMCGTLGLGASLDLLRQNGYSPQSNCIADRVISITDRLVQGLTGIGFECSSNRSPEHRSGIVSFTHPEADPAWLRSKLLDSNIVTSVRNNQLRFSPHAYVNEEDVKKAIEVLTDLVKQPN